MNIENAQYIQNLDNEISMISATIDGVVIFVPISTDNRHYQAILEWAEIDGNTIEEAD